MKGGEQGHQANSGQIRTDQFPQIHPQQHPLFKTQQQEEKNNNDDKEPEEETKKNIVTNSHGR